MTGNGAQNPKLIMKGNMIQVRVFITSYLMLVLVNARLPKKSICSVGLL
jgi:hypothetical protein